MPKSKVQWMAPKLDQNGQHQTWQPPGGSLMYKFDVQLEDGTRGEVNSTKQNGTFQVGAEVEYTYTASSDPSKYQGRLKLSDPNRASRQGGYGGGGGAAWTAERKAEVMAQGFIHAAVQSGAKDESSIVTLCHEQVKAYKRFQPQLVQYFQASEAPAAQQTAPQPPPPAQAPPPPPPPPAPAPPPPPAHQQPITGHDESSLPF